VKFTHIQRSAFVWIASGIFLIIYCILSFFGETIPGVEDLVKIIADTSGPYLYVAAFTSIFIEGIYILGNFFPGSTLVLLLAVLSQTNNVSTFLLTMIAIFIGWFLSGLINIYVAARIVDQSKIPKKLTALSKDNILATWYPTFRANYEVAQVVSGTLPREVVLSSIRVKFWSSLGLAIGALALPYFIDIRKVTNEEGFYSVLVVGVICLLVGTWQLSQQNRVT
jgi:hypothetical protein